MIVDNLVRKNKTSLRNAICFVAALLAFAPATLNAQYGNTPASHPYYRNSPARQTNAPYQQTSNRQNSSQYQQTPPQQNRYPVKRTAYQTDGQQSVMPPVNAMSQNNRLRETSPQTYQTPQVPNQHQFAQQQNLMGRLPYKLQATPTRSNLPSRATGMYERSRMLQSNLDSRANRVGDLLTVDVKIETVVNNQDRRQLRKSTGSDGNANAAASGTESIDIDYGSSSNRQLTGQTSLQEQRTMTDAFQTRILDVRNDILLIQGERYVTVQGDLRKLVLSGQINRRDISIGNRISSDYVYGMKLEYEGVGPEQEYIRQGWLKRQISKIWPF